MIARMNMGGPAYHVALLSGRLDRDRYETVLACGEVGPGEAPMTLLAERYSAQLLDVPGLGPRVSPIDDLRALRRLVGIVRSFRPHIVHTHTAKAGFLGRLAALLGRPRPLIVHTYHGHVLEGYFSSPVTIVYRALERLMGSPSDRLVGVSHATVDDLIRLKIAPPEKFRVIPLGLDLEPFAEMKNSQREAFRSELGLDKDDVLVTFVGRLVPVKRVDLLLRAVAEARRRESQLRLAVVGDGELRPELERLAAQLGMAQAVSFLGYRDNMVAVTAGADIAALSSASEGTPVSLIEAAAAAKPAVATDVGGVREVVRSDCGKLVPFGDVSAFARALSELASDPSLRKRLGSAAQGHVLERYSVVRLISDVSQLYDELLPGLEVMESSVPERHT